jgi:hypothetical protein
VKVCNALAGSLNIDNRGVEDKKSYPIVRELGFANICTGL